MTLKNIWDKNFDQFIEEWFKASGDMLLLWTLGTSSSSMILGSQIHKYNNFLPFFQLFIWKQNLVLIK